MILEENTGKFSGSNKRLSLQETSDDMMKERPDSVIRKKIAGRRVGPNGSRQRITDGQFEVGEKLPAEAGTDAYFRHRPFDGARSCEDTG